MITRGTPWDKTVESAPWYCYVQLVKYLSLRNQHIFFEKKHDYIIYNDYTPSTYLYNYSATIYSC